MSFALNCKCKYALSALVELATMYASGDPLQSREIARRQNIPDRYLEQVLATLKRGGLVRSQRGVNGGYLLSGEPSNISVLDVVQCVDGGQHNYAVISNGDGENHTMESLVVYEVWGEAQKAMASTLSQYSLKDIVEKRDVRQHASTMYYI
ncbi:MAG: Rrf2 family transcriptional regulator [Cyanobacteria bacterium P01_F01_bin.150]